jgi:hypothetical protein
MMMYLLAAALLLPLHPPDSAAAHSLRRPLQLRFSINAIDTIAIAG